MSYIIRLVCVSFALLALLSTESCFAGVSELRAKWENVANGVKEIDQQAAVESASVASQESSIPAQAETVQAAPAESQVVDPNAPKLTSTLVAWISSQCDGIVEEMEAIAKQNAESNSFSVVNYLRYLNLYDSLKVVASKQIPELKWVLRKAKVFSTVYQSAIEVVANYLADLDASLTKIELAEPKSKQVSVSKSWVELYESIRYIATHVSIRSTLQLLL